MTHRELVRLSTVSVGVPDPAASADFFVEGLRFHRTELPGSVALTCEGDYGSSPPAAALELTAAGQLGLEGLTFDVGLEVALDEYAERLRTADVEVTEKDDVLLVHDPDGIPVRLSQQRPRLLGELASQPLRPRKLGHTNLKVPDPRRSVDFYYRVLGLALSESIGEGMFFLRAGSEHHNLGIRGGSDRADVHHIGFEVTGWDTYRLVCDHLAALGHTVEYGPGRHGPGNNLFVYLRDPSSGLRLELYSDMAHIQDDEEYEAPVWELSDRPKTVNKWGPAPPASFLE